MHHSIVALVISSDESLLFHSIDYIRNNTLNAIQYNHDKIFMTVENCSLETQNDLKKYLYIERLTRNIMCISNTYNISVNLCQVCQLQIYIPHRRDNCKKVCINENYVSYLRIPHSLHFHDQLISIQIQRI